MLTFFLIVLLLGALGVGGWLLRGYLTGQGAGAAIMGNSREKRLGVVEQASVDGRRKLLLIRRDGTEHLVMTGGPVDVVIETGIAPVHRPAYERVNGPALDPDPRQQAPGFTRIRQPTAVQGQEQG